MTGGTGPTGPTGPTGATGATGTFDVTGTTGQTIYHDGSDWAATGNLHHDGINVGIGTVTPAERLHVHGTGIQRVRVESTDDNANFRMTSPVADYSWVAYGAENSAGLYDFNSGMRRISVDSAGQVGIGTLTPDSDLEVVGKLRVTKGTGHKFFEVFNDDDSVIVSMGFGDTDQLSQLDFNVLTTADTNAAEIRFFRGTNTTGGKRILLMKGNNSTNYSTQFGIDGMGSHFLSGNLGVGTATPAQKLEVSGHVRQTTYSEPMVVPGSGVTSYTWTHNFGYQPIIMLSLDQTGGEFFDYVNVSYGHVDNNSLTIFLGNRLGVPAIGTVRWIVVH